MISILKQPLDMICLKDQAKINIEELSCFKNFSLIRDYQKRVNPFLPRIRKISNEKVEIAGISIFQEDKEVDIFPVEKLFFFKLLVDKYSEGNFDVQFSENEIVAVKSLRSKHKIDFTDNKAVIQ
ncbi:hypothetical protein [Sporosarcina globispora]|uniref:hypothetical protein n=1 Tax=Sporosarcina globispora TaxID=1459 RepID=UPI00128F529B|nr:hypothetical protein [Sporosarcina globispora]